MVSDDLMSIATSNAEKYLVRAGEKHPFRYMETAVVDARRKLEKMKSTDGVVASMVDEEKKMLFIENENVTIRKELKHLNEHLTRLLEYVRDQNLVKGKKKEERPTSQRMRARDEEIKNSDKQIKNLVYEHQKLTKRIEQVSNPRYEMDLKTQISEAGREIARLRKEQKLQEVDQFRREKKMERIIQAGGETENRKVIAETQKELEVLSDKMRRQADKHARLEDAKESQEKAIQDLRGKLDALVQRSRELGIDEARLEEQAREGGGSGEEEDPQESLHEVLMKKKRVLMQVFESMKKKMDVALLKEKKGYREILEQKHRVAIEVREKVEAMRAKGQLVSGLIDRARASGDKAKFDLLLRYEASLETQLQKYDSPDALPSVESDPQAQGKKIIASIDQMLARKKNLEELVNADESKNSTGPAEGLRNYKSVAELEKNDNGLADRPAVKKEASQNSIGQKVKKKPKTTRRDDGEELRRKMEEEETQKKAALQAEAEEAERKNKIAEQQKEAALQVEKAERKKREEEVAAAAAEAEAAALDATKKMEAVERKKQETPTLSSKPSFAKPNLLGRRREHPTPTGAQEVAAAGAFGISQNTAEVQHKKQETIPFSQRIALKEGSRGSGVASTPLLPQEKEEVKYDNPYAPITKD